ncbi:MAG: translational GTPase TypA [Tissierellia bacterium]|nr:translational GTPase TypA [Tissierellia bacterium]
MTNSRLPVRNVAIIAHVDHGKTTLVDGLLKQSGVFRQNQEIHRVMDSNDIEKERGITILAKNTAVIYKDTKINIIDTPGHADFGGEVERILKMVDGVVLLVDAFEGPMPQTKFVLRRAFDLNLPVVTCINKIDRPEARPEEVVSELLDLFIDLGADESVLEAPIIYTSAKQGWAIKSLDDEQNNMEPLFNAILDNIPAPIGDEDKPLQLLISAIDYNDYVGRIAIGRIEQGIINQRDKVVLVNAHDGTEQKIVTVANLFTFSGLERIPVERGFAGDIVAVTGIENITIGDTLTSVDNPIPLDFVKISEPTIAVTFSVNDSPLAGRVGKFVTSRQLRSRLYKECQTDVSLRVEDTGSTESFLVSGRGELHLSVLIENMRREGYEFQISKPVVLFKNDNGKKLEPMERAYVDVNQEFLGAVIEKLGNRKGELVEVGTSRGYTRAEFIIPARGLIGYRQEFLTDTKGTGILNTAFDGYSVYKGDIPTRKTGSIIACDSGVSTAYGLYNAQERGELFIEPGLEIYEGMVVGENPKGLDLEVSVTRKKQQSNVRSSGSDDALRLSPPKVFSLEQALEFIEEDELIEVTPESFRIRKKILDQNKRYKSKK